MDPTGQTEATIHSVFQPARLAPIQLAPIQLAPRAARQEALPMAIPVLAEEEANDEATIIHDFRLANRMPECLVDAAARTK